MSNRDTGKDEIEEADNTDHAYLAVGILQRHLLQMIVASRLSTQKTPAEARSHTKSAQGTFTQNE